MKEHPWLPEPAIQGRALDKLLCKRLGIPRGLVHPVLRRYKRGALRERLADCQELIPASAPPLAIPRDDGYRRFDASALASWREARDFALTRLDDARNQWAPVAGNPRKEGFLRTIADGDELVRRGDTLSLMLSPELLDAASHYLGALPQLAGAALWWTPPNDSARRSQLWHVDDEDRHQVKVLINLTDTGPDQGPFTLLPAALSRQVMGRIAGGRFLGGVRRLGRLTDERVEAAGGAGGAVPMMGPAGSGVLVDSSACLHHGSRGNSADRLVLMFHYLPWDTPTTSTYRFRREGALPNLPLDQRQRLVLGVRGEP